VGISGEATNEIGKSLKALLARLGFASERLTPLSKDNR
jgi:hypothetical protein